MQPLDFLIRGVTSSWTKKVRVAGSQDLQPQILVWLATAQKYIKKAIGDHTGLDKEEIPDRMVETLAGLCIGAQFLDEHIQDKEHPWWKSGGSEGFYS